LILVKKLLKFGVMLLTDTIKKHWLKIVLIIVLAAAAIYVSTRISSVEGNKPFVPSEFLEARSRGAIIADQIVALSKESISNLSTISTEDEIGNYSVGLNLVLEEIERNKKTNNAAVELSNELGLMATGLSQVQPEDAAKIGLEAVINETQIVQRLINYNSYAGQLLDVLQSRFTAGSGGPETDRKVKELISKMNEEAEAINELNSKYLELMSKFNELTAK